MKKLSALVAAFAVAAPFSAHAIEDVRISADQPVEVIFAQIAEAAVSICQEAKARGDISSVYRCTVVVVDATVRATENLELIQYASNHRAHLWQISAD